MRIHLGTRILATNTVNLVVAGAFTVMGGFVMYPGRQRTDDLRAGVPGGLRQTPGLEPAGWRRPLPIPEFFLGLVVLARPAYTSHATLRDRKRGAPPPSDGDDDLEPGTAHPDDDTADVASTYK